MTKRKIAKIIREDYPANYTGYNFITLIQFNDEKYLSIVDIVTTKLLSAYILDLCGPKNIDEEMILNIALDWSNSDRRDIPISYEFARLQMHTVLSPLYKSFNVDFIERAIGPLPATVDNKPIVKRKKRKILPKETQILFR